MIHTIAVHVDIRARVRPNHEVKLGMSNHPNHPNQPNQLVKQPQKPCKTPKPRSSNGLTKLTSQFIRARVRPKHVIKLGMSNHPNQPPTPTNHKNHAKHQNRDPRTD
jgi:hypothetical protein